MLTEILRARPARYMFTAVVLVLALSLAACGSGSTPTESDTPDGTAADGADADGEETLKQVALYKQADLALMDMMLDRFIEGMSGAGFEEGDGVEYSVYSAQGQSNLIPTVANQIIDSAPDLIFAAGTPAVLAVANATDEIPIVFGAMGDPVGAGVAESLEEPGGMATGTTDWIPPADSLDVVLEALPDAERIGNIYDPSNQNGEVFHAALAEAVEEAGLQLVDVSIANPGEVQNAARSLVGRVDLILIGPDAQVIQGNAAIAAAALENDIPFIATLGQPEVEGQLMTLGVDYGYLSQRAGEQAAMILNGEDPGSIPIEGMDTFTIYINPQTQEALGLSLPDSIMERAEMWEGDS